MGGSAVVRSSRGALTGRRVLIIGAGGLGCPAALALIDTGAILVVADDDTVELSNLHRQFLYDDDDVGHDKLEALSRALQRRGLPRDRLELVRSRFLPENGRELVRSVDLVLEGADNYATKFLSADCAVLEGRPIVHGAAIRWVATAFAVGPAGKPCYRCLFEDLPRAGAQQSCATAGVVGPVVGFAGALMAELALRVLCDGAPDARIRTYDGRMDRLREVAIEPRASCALCGTVRSIFEIEETRYTAPSCAA